MQVSGKERPHAGNALCQRCRWPTAPRLKRLDEKSWSEKTAQLVVEGRVFETTLGHMWWLGLFDALHHRGQLSVYLRHMGGKVPSIYGPSADDPRT